MSDFIVFYAGQVHAEFDYVHAFTEWRRSQATENREVYNGAYVYDRSIRGWWRMDMTPVLLSDVPKKLRILLLIMS